MPRTCSPNYSRQFLTIKFLSRPRSGRHSVNELSISQFVKDHCSSPFVSTIRGSFKIPHHLAQADPRYEGVVFDAVFYPVTGTDLRRISEPLAYPKSRDKLPLSSRRRKRCIRDVALGLAALHDIGVVHGGKLSCSESEPARWSLGLRRHQDIHPGNVALPPPSRHDIEHYLATKQPLVHEIRRKDGTPTHPTLPCRVTEPVDIGFGDDGHTTILDLGFAFRPTDGASYDRANFPRGTLLPPELLHSPDAAISHPFKVDSWHLGLCVSQQLLIQYHA